ncbi:MAG TPA: PleD family two-component system response regulator [Alphaproteobacteria bacterium]|nr:PleD family two-component system response regulator [Alphaproteobacteria bacterium]
MSARILVVDDVLPNVKLLQAKLTREYFDVVTAFNGPEALDSVKAQAPDLVLLDVMMPGMDGFEVCGRIKADPATSHVPVIMVTALSDAADRVRGLEAGADDFLTKPVNDVALFARVKSLVRLKMTMDEWRLRQRTSGQLGVMPEAPQLMSESAEAAHVLVLEDSTVDTGKIVEALSRDRHVTTTAATIAEALEKAQGGDFDLVVVSLTLLEEDGLRVLSQLRSNERTRGVPVLLIVDDGDLNRTVKGLELGATDYLAKPIDRNELLARVRTQIRRKRFQDRLRASYEQSLSLALTDSLTGLHNRRYALAHLDHLVQQMAVTGKPLSLLMFDIDHFKQVNDTWGHPVGDEVLRELAKRVSGNLRSFDLVARLGGEEFVVIMPDTPLDAAVMVAERLRNRVAGTLVKVSAPVGEIQVTISIGAACATATCTADDLLRRADAALYAAKNAGRNRVCSEAVQPEGETPSYVV